MEADSSSAGKRDGADREQIRFLQEQIDELQSEISKPHRWYTDASVIIAMLAFLFSLGTTIFSYQQAQQQQIGAYKTELRDIITRISEIPRDYTAYAQTYTDPATLGQLNGSLQAENGMLAKRAVEIVKKIPREVTSSEYLLIGQSLFTSNAVDDTMQMYDLAIRGAGNSNDLVAALRMKANLQMLLGEIDAGRVTYRQALNVFEQFPVINEFYVNSTLAMTEINWAVSEFSIGACDRVSEHLAAADQAVDQLHPESSAKFYRDQLASYQKATQNCEQAP